MGKQAGISPNTVSRFENGFGAMAETLVQIQETLEGAGIIFIWADNQAGPGIRLRDIPPKKKSESDNGLSSVWIDELFRIRKKPSQICAPLESGFGSSSVPQRVLITKWCSRSRSTTMHPATNFAPDCGCFTLPTNTSLCPTTWAGEHWAGVPTMSAAHRGSPHPTRFSRCFAVFSSQPFG